MRIINDLRNRGLESWDEEYPNKTIIHDDICTGSVILAYISRKTEQIIGTVTLTSQMYERALHEIKWLKETDEHIEIARLAVDPLFQEQGLGRILFDHAFRSAIRQGARSVRLEVLYSEKSLIAMYERRGFLQRGSIWENHKEFLAMEYVTPDIAMLYSTKEQPNHEKIIAACHTIREEVFIVGQNVPEEIDLDGKDIDFDHILLKFGDIIAGCVRLNTSQPDTVKLERLAVIERFRGYGFGKLLLERGIELCEDKKISKITMHAQYYLKEYYEASGFSAVGEPFYEADIKHIEMVHTE